MPYKACPFCFQTSYSAASHSTTSRQNWFCPCCGEEISTAGSKQYPPPLLSAETAKVQQKKRQHCGSNFLRLLPERKAE